MIQSRLTRSGPPPVPHRRGTHAPQVQESDEFSADEVELSEAARAKPNLSSWLSHAALGVTAVVAVASLTAPAAQAAELSVRDHNFEVVETLVYDKGDKAPCGDSVDLLKEYAQTDFGAPIVAEIARDAQQAVADGLLTPDGDVTEEGMFEGYQPFRISCGTGAQGGPNGIVLPAKFAKRFRYSGQEIHPLAIVHHEMGHTKYGMPAQPSDIVTDEHGSRYSVEHELEIVKRFENPVREEYGYKPRTSYTNHLGETATIKP